MEVAVGSPIGKLSVACEQVTRTVPGDVAGILQALTTVQAVHDPYTVLHQRRVAKLSAAVAVAYGLQMGHPECLVIAAQLHDIGRLQVPPGISAKFWILGIPEIQLIQRHPRSGVEILRSIDFRHPVAEVVLQHHEHRDGSGYPTGLSGGDIHIEAKIIAVADAIESMLSHRPYRPAFDLSAVISEVRRGRGGLYDPVVADVALSLLSGPGFEGALLGRPALGSCEKSHNRTHRKPSRNLAMFVPRSDYRCSKLR